MPAITSLLLLLGIFLLIQSLLPLGTAVQIGADEGFNLAKATLSLKGFKLYTDIWSDQPPLHAFLITWILKNISPSVLGPRLVSVASAVLLLSSLFLISRRINGLAVAIVTTALVMASPGFIELSSSCMLEMPALGIGMAAFAVAVLWSPERWYLRDLACGALFGTALQTKIAPFLLVPLAVWMLGARQDANVSSLKRMLRSGAVLLLSAALAWVAIDLVLDGGAYMAHFQQTWSAHFAPAKSFEYGSARERPFEWPILLRNWDTTLPACAGMVMLAIGWRARSRTTQGLAADHGARAEETVVNRCVKTGCALELLPLVWLGLSLGFFAVHRPWWSYYYIHIAIPLCWCAAIALAGAVRTALALSTPRAAVAAFSRTGPRSSHSEETPPGSTQERFSRLKSKALRRQVQSKTRRPSRHAKARRLMSAIGLAAFLLCAGGWQVARVYLQVTGVRNSPQVYSSPVLVEIARYRPFAKFMYTQDIIYSFHAGLPLPPGLAVVSLKRLWSGDLTSARIAAELNAIKPEIMLLRNDARELPFQDLVNSEYKLVYYDARHRLYAHRTISRKPGYGEPLR